LFCGKEIGAFRLMKDREFCRADHRKKYGSRLGKAIVQLAEPEPPPAEVATFVLTMPIQIGQADSRLARWMTPARTNACAPLSDAPAPADTMRLPGFELAIVPPGEEPTEPVFHEAPPASRGPVPAPGPEPVFSFVQTATATEPAPCTIPVRFAVALQPLPAISTPRGPAIQQTWMPVPAPEAVWAAVQASATLNSVTAAQPHETLLPAVPSVVEPMPVVDEFEQIPAVCERPVRAPQPEPVWSFVQPAAALEPALHSAAMLLPHIKAQIDPRPLPAASAAPALQPEPVFRMVQPAVSFETAAAACAIQLPRFTAQIEPLPLPDAPAMPSLQPEPVSHLVQSASSLELAGSASVIQFPRLAAEVEPMPIADETIDPPQPCLAWMPAPSAEPVFAYVHAASADSASAALAVRQPGLSELRAAGPHIPSVPTFLAGPQAEPVMAGVWPHVADIPFEPILNTANLALPQISTLRVPAAQPRPTPLVAAPAAEAAETFISASQSATHLSAATMDCALPPEQMAPAAHSGSPQLAVHAAGPAPEALESLLTASTADQIKSAPVVRLQPFAVAASEGRTLPGFDAPRLAPPAACQPPAAARKLVVMPLTTIRVAAPAPVPQEQPLMPSIPQPGLVALEFHAQQVRGKSECKLEWRTVRFAPLPPRFALRPVWEKADLSAQKPLPPKSSMADVFAMPEAKPKRSKLLAYAGKIAAGIIVVMATWYGASSIKMDRSLQVRAGGSSTSGLPSASVLDPAGSRTSVASAPKPESKGAIASVRQSISRRAAVQISDNLREGMEAWGATAKSYPAGWSRNANGYVHPGALALFSPTKSFTDYRMEFFGQIDTKSIGWTVRSKDEKNYHAMKFTVIEQGLRPVIAMVHYNVVDGKAGRKLQTPLSIMVHNNRPIQVAVNVKGNHYITSVDGEEVDSYSDDTLASGGIGFFSEAGEKARLYWVKVSKNDDWLGHVCAFLSGVDAAPVGAELWAPELPGSPAPFHPDGDHASLAGAWIAAPFLRVSRKARLAKSRRYQEWNT
jgi:hypothetical protein